MGRGWLLAKTSTLLQRHEDYKEVSFMALRLKRYLWVNLNSCLMHSRFYSTKIDWNKLRPMIQKRIKERAKDYPVRSMVPVAYDVLTARSLLIDGLSTLLNIIPIKACKFCPEVYVGDRGHGIKTCHGYRRTNKNKVHTWTIGSLNDILVPVEAFHLHHMFQDVIKHEQRFDFDRVPAVLELCFQAGADIDEENLLHRGQTTDDHKCDRDDSSRSFDDLRSVAQRTLEAWERMRLGVQKLLLVYPSKVCQYCSEAHIGPSGHKARLCGVFKNEAWRGTHFWKKAEVDNLVPPKVVWRRRPQDPLVLLDSGRGFYGHAPAVVEVCLQAGAIVPSKYYCMMKENGLQPP